MIGFGVLGYVMRKLKYYSAPLVLALVLGPMMERSFRESMMISRGNLGVFVTRPICAALLFAGLLIVLAPPIISALRRKQVGDASPA
jgi:putative tricarboxylic transport membrane protein